MREEEIQAGAERQQRGERKSREKREIPECEWQENRERKISGEASQIPSSQAVRARPRIPRNRKRKLQREVQSVQ